MAKFLGLVGEGNELSGVKSAARTMISGARVIGSKYSRTSITKMAQNTIFQYPFIISGAIETTKAMSLLKANESSIATFVISSIARRNSVDLDKYENIDAYLAQIHNNGELNPNFITNMVGGWESYTVTDVKDASNMFSKDHKYQMALECWNEVDPIGALDTESLNDIYRPFDRTRRDMLDRMRQMSNATEASGQNSRTKAERMANPQSASDRRELLKAMSANANGGRIGRFNPAGDMETPMGKVGKVEVTYRGADGKEHKGYKTQWNGSSVRGTIASPSIMGKVSAALSTMDPTLLNVSLTCHSKDRGNWDANIVVGIKAVPRVVPSEAIISNMADAVVNGNAIFSFIKLADKETKTAMFMFGPLKGLKDSRDAALAKYSGGEQFMNLSKKRKMFDSLQKIKNAPVPPNMNIIITTYEAQKVYEITGVDLMDARQARMIIDKYYVLSFSIFDTETDEYRIMYDTDTDWSIHNIYSINQPTYDKVFKEMTKSVKA